MVPKSRQLYAVNETHHVRRFALLFCATLECDEDF